MDPEPAGVLEDLLESARWWHDNDPDWANRREAEAIIERADPDELRQRFGRRLRFGTAGIRAVLGAGPMRLNRLVAQQTAAGIAKVLDRQGAEAPVVGVVVAHDARVGSNAFAAAIVDVLTGESLGVHLLDGPAPTPLATFALRHLGAAAAVVVTASHNPAEYNGIKVYWSDGAQIAPPLDAEIALAIDEAAAEMEARTGTAGVGTDASVDRGPVTHLGAVDASSPLVEAYVEAAASLVPGAPAEPIPIATSAMHGVGGSLLSRTLSALGHGRLHSVVEQQDPDPRFPTVSFPNPEEPGAMDAVIELGRRRLAALALALDPDADRLAVAAPLPDGSWRALTGDETGAILLWRCLQLTEKIPDRLVVTTVVSSRLAGAMAAAAGAHFAETLTGFKWLSRPAIENPNWYQVLAYEEALGYAVGPDARDKDGITAAVVMSDAACSLAATGRSVWDLLDELACLHGAHVTNNGSRLLEGSDAPVRLAELARTLAADPPGQLGGSAVIEVTQPAGDVIRLDLAEGTRVVLRPSGTEPRFKYYCEAVEQVGPGEDPASARDRAASRLTAIASELDRILT